MQSIDDNTQVAIEIIMKGVKVSEELILHLLESLEKQLQDENSIFNKSFLNTSTPEGKMKINDLISKHKDRVVALDDNLTKEQLKDYVKEFKKLGVDFSITKNDKDNYSFFFSGQQEKLIEKALKNVSELKNSVLEDQKVSEAENELMNLQEKLDPEVVSKVKNLHDRYSDLNDLKEKMDNLSVEEKELLVAYQNVDGVKAQVQAEKIEAIESEKGEKTNDEKENTPPTKKELLNNMFKDLNENEKVALYSLNSTKIEEFQNKKNEERYNAAPKDFAKNDYEKLKSSMPKDSIDKIEKIANEYIHADITKLPESKVFIHSVDKQRKIDGIKTEDYSLLADNLQKQNVSEKLKNLDTNELNETLKLIQENYGFDGSKIEKDPEKINDLLSSFDPESDDKITYLMAQNKIEAVEILENLKDSTTKEITQEEKTVLNKAVENKMITKDDLKELGIELEVEKESVQNNKVENNEQPKRDPRKPDKQVKKGNDPKVFSVAGVKEINKQIKENDNDKDKAKNKNKSVER